MIVILLKDCLEAIYNDAARVSEVVASNEKILKSFYDESECEPNDGGGYYCKDDSNSTGASYSVYSQNSVSSELFDASGVWGSIYQDGFYHSM